MGRGLRIAGVILLSAMWVYACSGDAGPEGPSGDGDAGEPAGGNASAGGASDGTQAGVGAQAGAGGDRTTTHDQGGQGGVGGDNDQLREACGPYPLADFCSVHPKSCPMSPDAFPLDGLCCFSDVQRTASTCGGTVVRESQVGIYSASWSYDTEGHLVGYIIKGDVGTPCEEGGYSLTVIYGDNCEPLGSPEDLCEDVANPCGAGGAGGAAGAGGAGG